MEKKKDKDDDPKRIGILISKEIKSKWQNFVDENEFTTISMLIRDAVNFYIDSRSKIKYLENFSQLSHDLKEPLTVIKGYSQIIIENNKNDIDLDILLRIKEIINQCEFLEKKINEISTEIEEEELQPYDILIIDDDKPTIAVLTDFLRIKGYTCKGINTGASGLKEISKFKPKLILLDIILPDIDGYDVCSQIKSNEKLNDIPIYYITAIPGSEVNKKLEETGADGFFLKPFDFKKFEVIFNLLK